MPRYAAMQPIRLRFPAVFAAVLLAGCSSTPSPLVSEPQRTGADQSTTVLQTLPASASNRQYDPGIAPENEEKGQKVGAIVTTKGGQKTQKEKEEQERTAVEKDLDRKRADQTRQQNADERKTTVQ
jgi:hypothetical protein